MASKNTDTPPEIPQDITLEHDGVQLNAVARQAVQIAEANRVAQFRGRPMVMDQEPFPHFVPLHSDRFYRMAYPLLGGLSRSKMGDIFAYLTYTAEDLTNNDHLVCFGYAAPQPEDLPDSVKALQPKSYVWDMEELRRVAVEPDQTIWRSPYFRSDKDERVRVSFVMSLAGGDEELYDDIMQSLAPLIMSKKPDGVIWWVGDGANGKSTLMDAIYKIFPGQLSSITVKRLTDGRDTPSLNGTLANVVKESSEGRIDDTEIYKSIGTHEDFRVHKFHSQDDISIRGNIHHIFNANSIPTFNDKGYSARRRTFVIPFSQRFKSDPAFEDKTFTKEMFGQLIAEMCHYAVKLKEQGYRYKWSAKTLAAKEAYDTEANSAEEYARFIIKEGVVAFDSFSPVRNDYENWCADNGYVPLGVGNMRRALQAVGFERMSIKKDDKVVKHYKLPNFDNDALASLSVSRPGLFTVAGFEAPIAQQTKPVKKQASILGGEW